MARTNLFHGTGEQEDPYSLASSSDLNVGYDQMLHFHTRSEPMERMYPYILEASMPVDLDDIPTIPDLRDWNPVKLAEEFAKQGLLTEQQVEQIRQTGH